MADDAPSPHGLAALAISVSLVEALLKQGVIDAATVEAALKEANLYAQALCADCSPGGERAKRNSSERWPPCGASRPRSPSHRRRRSPTNGEAPTHRRPHSDKGGRRWDCSTSGEGGASGASG